MKDLEARLRSLKFREPPPGLRGATLAALRSPGWKDWVAPHPAAWAALAALWLALVVLDGLLNGSGADSEVSKVARAAPPEGPALLAFYQHGGAVEPAL